MWFGTREGLNRYDGFSFTVYKHSVNDSNTISNNVITVITEDHDGMLWVGTNEGLNSFNPYTEKIKRYYLTDAPLSEKYSIRSIYVDSSLSSTRNNKQKIIWVGTYQGGLYKISLDGENISYQHFQYSSEDNHSIGGNAIGGILRDERGTLWVGTDNRTLNQYVRSTNSFIRHLIDLNETQHASFYSLFLDSRHQMWASIFNRGVYQVSREYLNENTIQVTFTPKTKSKFVQDDIYGFPVSVIEDLQGNIWANYYYYGLEKYERTDVDSSIVTHYYYDGKKASSLSSNLLRSIFISKNNILWAGDEGYGINKALLTKKFSLYRYDGNDSTSLRSKSLRGIYELPDGKLLLGGYSPLMTFDRKRGVLQTKIKNVDSPKSSEIINSVYCIAPDPLYADSIVWLGTEGYGLMRYNFLNYTFKKYIPDVNNSNSLLYSWIKSLYADKNGLLWVGTEGGLQSMDVKNFHSPTFTTYKHDEKNPQSISNGVISSIYRSSKGILWVASNPGGLNAMIPSETNIFHHYISTPSDSASIGSNLIKTIHEDNNGTMWFGTDGGGLNKLLPDGKSFQQYLEEDGLPNNTVYGILEDSSGSLWLSTNKGISRFIPSSNEFWNFSLNDGLQDEEFNTASYYQCKHGEMFFGGINGLNAFFPEQMKRNSYIPPVHITSMKIFDKEIPHERRLASPLLSLAYDENVLSFEFTSLDYSEPSRNQFKYKMDGNDVDWVYAGNRRYVSYAHLSPGEYTFNVKGSNSAGIWNEQPATISFIIRPPFWATWWFRSLAVILFLSVGPAFYYRRVSSLKKEQRRQQEFSRQLINTQETERRRMARELHDGLGQELMIIANKSQSASEMEKLSLIKSKLNEISQTALTAIGSVREIAFNLSPYQLEQLGLTSGLRSMIEKVSASYPIIFTHEIENIDGCFSNEAEINIYRIVQECLNNIVKHSEATESLINITISREQVVIVISDNGKGFDFDSVLSSGFRSGFGLAGLDERIRLLHGTYTIESAPMNGTTFSCSIIRENNEANN